MRPNKETLENIRKAAKELEKVERAEGPHMHATICLRPEVANELLAEIDALTTELKASEWVRKDNSLRTYDGLTEENERLREHLAYITKTRDTYADMLKHSLDHHKQCHGECSFIFAHSDDTQAAQRCKHDVHGTDCFECYPKQSDASSEKDQG